MLSVSVPDAGAIAGGEPARPGLWTAIARGGGAACTGTLIAPRRVLTAKHCVMDGPSRQVHPWIVGSGISVGNPAGGGLVEYRTVIEVRTHPDFVLESWTPDFAVLSLDRSVSIGPVPLATPEEDAELTRAGTPLITVGYGHFDSSEVSSDVPRAGALRVIDYSYPAPYEGIGAYKVFARPADSAAADGTPPGAICTGDSGGPAFGYSASRGQWVQLGVVSEQGTPECDLNDRSGFDRVAKVYDWLQAELARPLPPEPQAATPPPPGTARVVSKKLAMIGRASVPLALSCPTSAPYCSGSLHLRTAARGHGRAKRRGLKLGSTGYRVPPGQSGASIVVSRGRRALVTRLLKRRRPLRVVVTSVSAPSGARTSVKLPLRRGPGIKRV